MGRQMGQYHGVGESHYRTTTLHNDVLSRLRDNSLRPDTHRGLFRGIGRRGVERGATIAKIEKKKKKKKSFCLGTGQTHHGSINPVSCRPCASYFSKRFLDVNASRPVSSVPLAVQEKRPDVPLKRDFKSRANALSITRRRSTLDRCYPRGNVTPRRSCDQMKQRTIYHFALLLFCIRVTVVVMFGELLLGP